MGDFLYPEPDEEQEDDEEIEGEEGSEIDEEEQMSSMQKKMFERREKRLDKKLDKMIQQIPNRFYPFFTPWEKKDYNEAQKHKKLHAKLIRLDAQVSAARFRKHASAMGGGTTGITTIIPFAMIILIALVLAAAIMMILGLIDSNGNTTEDGAGGAAPMGPKGKDFYAVRAVYTDDEQAEIDQIGDYIDIMRGVKEQIDTDISGLEITFNLDLPEDGEIAEFIENKNTGDWIIAYETVDEMVDVVYKYDNEDGVETELSTQLGLIKYFGYNEEMIKLDGDNNDLTDIIKANLLQYQTTLFAPIEEDGELPSDLTEIVDASIDAYMATVSDMRAEKIYIKDFVLDGDDATMEGIEKADYKAIMLYAKNEVNLQYMQFYGINVDVEKFVAYIDDNGTKIEFDIVPTDNADYYNKTTVQGQQSQEEPDKKLYNYEIDHSFSIPVGEEPTYLSTIVDDASVLNLYDILIVQGDSIDSSTLLVGAVDEEGKAIENVYTFKIDGYAIMTEYDEAFEFSMMLEPKSQYLP